MPKSGRRYRIELPIDPELLMDLKESGEDRGCFPEPPGRDARACFPDPPGGDARGCFPDPPPRPRRPR